MELNPTLVDYVHNFSTMIIAGIVFLSMAVSFFVYKYFDHDFWNNDTYGD